MEIEYDEQCYHSVQVWRIVLPREFNSPPSSAMAACSKRVTIEDFEPVKVADYHVPAPNADRLYFVRQN